MRFPLSLTAALTGYLLRKRLSGQQRFPLVLMLEPLHACNLSCTGCGRIREYADTVGQRMSVAECLAAVRECGAPVVSICGGEPLIYPEIGELVARVIAAGKHVYLCTNGVKLAESVAPGTVPIFAARGRENGTVPFGATTNCTPLHPYRRLFVNVHLDGMEATHDRLVQRAGTFAAAVAGIRAARAAGFAVCTNTTVYRDTDMHEVAVLFDFLAELGVGGFMIAPAYGYAAVRADNPATADEVFLTRREVHEKFSAARPLLAKRRLMASPIYLDFLCGRRDLECAAWANPTCNVRGWRSPCYLIADGHQPTYRELLDNTDWAAFGPGRDARCDHCLMHCGFEPAAVLAANRHVRDMLKMAAWQMG